MGQVVAPMQTASTVLERLAANVSRDSPWTMQKIVSMSTNALTLLDAATTWTASTPVAVSSANVRLDLSTSPVHAWMSTNVELITTVLNILHVKTHLEATNATATTAMQWTTTSVTMSTNVKYSTLAAPTPNATT
jgi:hypothetical protein